jgi:transcriptional regulator with XRE-family HTH domain
LADKIGISRQAVSKWERAESTPDTDNLIALSKLYQISLGELLNTQEPPGILKSAVIEKPANSANSRNRKYGMYLFPYPVVAVILFFLIGFFSKHWNMHG